MTKKDFISKVKKLTTFKVIVDDDNKFWIGDICGGNYTTATDKEITRTIEREGDRIEEAKFWRSPRGRKIEDDEEFHRYG